MMGMIDNTQLRNLLIRAKERVEDTRDWNDIVGGDDNALNNLVSDLDNAISDVSKNENLFSPESLMELRKMESMVVSECNRVLGVMLSHLNKIEPFLYVKSDLAILKKGLVKPQDWWRVLVHDHNCQKLDEPLMEIGAWDGLEPDNNSNCSVCFPLKWLSMTSEELKDLFKKGVS